MISTIILTATLALTSAQTFPLTDPLPDCQIFSNNQCAGNTITTEPKFEAYRYEFPPPEEAAMFTHVCLDVHTCVFGPPNSSLCGCHRWFTPAASEEGWQPSFQDYSHLFGWSTINYSADLRSATVTVTAEHKINATLSYEFGGKAQTSNVMKFDATTTAPVSLSVLGSDKTKIDLEPLDFRWNRAELKLTFPNGDYRSGQKGAIVEMFGWPHAAVEKECAFLAKSGYMGVKVFPPQESIMSTEPFQGVMNPWYFFYQPVSYKLESRAGSRDELRSMINTCRSQGVRVYADAVVNHMTGGGNDAKPDHRNPNANCQVFGAKQSTLEGGSSPMYTQVSKLRSESEVEQSHRMCVAEL